MHSAVFVYTLSKPAVLLTADSVEYLNASQNLARSRLLYAGSLLGPVEPELYSRRTPLYPLFVALAQMAWSSVFAISAAQVALALLNAFLLYGLLGHLGVEGRSRVAVVGAYLFYPAQVIYVHMVMAEMLLQTFLVLGIYFLARFIRDGRLALLALFDLCLSLATLTKPVLLYFWVPNAIYHLFLAWRCRKSTIAIFAVLPVLTIVLWSWRNHGHTGYFHFSSIKNHNLLYYNTYRFLMSHAGEAEADRFVDTTEHQIASMGFADANRSIERRCWEVLTRRPLAYALYHLRGMIWFALDPGRFDIYQFLGYVTQGGFLSHISRYGLVRGIGKVIANIQPGVLTYLVFVALVNGLLLSSFVWFILKGTSALEVSLFLVLLPVYLAFVTGPLGASRHRLPAVPYLLLTLPVLWGSLSRCLFRSRHTTGESTNGRLGSQRTRGERRNSWAGD